ncbi:MAG: DUF6273 domain-containing protein [Eubacterium sp.]|nr:DUF6273 domain-containing protein [Eubacterium sp.]
MSLGFVNVPGTASTDLAAVKSSADAALEKANANEREIRKLTSAATTPVPNGIFTYTGSEITPIWNGYDSSKLTIGGTTKATKAGTYTAEFTPKGNYTWSDGTNNTVSVQWSICKAACSVTLNKSSVSLNTATLTSSVSVTKSGDGIVTAITSNNGVAAVSVSGNTVTITGKGNGNATVIVNVAEGTNHTAAESKTIYVTVSLPSATLSENTPESIQAAAKSGTAPNYWSVGDKIGITLNGSVGNVIFSNDVYYAYIIGFNHNKTIEGNNSIHFQFGISGTGTNIAFCDKNYAANQLTTGFVMNTSATNLGGWKSSYMRNTICSQFFNAMPAKWQNVIKACTKYTDNTGGNCNTAGNVTSTSDKIWLLSCVEVQINTPSSTNSAEKNYTSIYSYFANGNKGIKSKHNAEKNEVCIWWLRTPWNFSGDDYFVTVTTSGALNGVEPNRSFGFAPCFMVA